MIISAKKDYVTPYQAYFINPHNPFSNRVLTSIYEVRGKNLVTRLENAWQILIARHETLRQSFLFEKDNLYQITQAPFTLELNCYDDNPAINVEEIIAHYTSFFDLQNIPLLRVHVFKKSADCYWMLLEIHHALIDGVASILLLQELMALLSGLSLPELTYSYSDYKHHLQDYLASKQAESQRNYWENKLLKAPISFLLPTDLPYSNCSTAPFSMLTLNEETSCHIEEFIRTNKITKYVFFIGVFSLLLQLYSGSNEAVFVSVAALRSQPQFKEVIAACSNYVTFRVASQNDMTLLLYFNTVFREVFAAMAYMEYPFIQLTKNITFTHPIDSIAFFFHSHVSNVTPILTSADAKNSIQLLHTQTFGGTRHLQFDIIEQGKNYLCRLSYNENIFYPSTINRLLNLFQVLIEHILVANSQKTSLSELFTKAKASLNTLSNSVAEPNKELERCE
jgi:hypothetical protein